MSTEQYIYRLDSSDTITFVNSDYEHFARQNEAPELADRMATVGKSIWTFIASDEVQTLYRLLFNHLRSRKSEFIVPFRCDSPSVIRHMQLTLRSLNYGGIECEGKVLHTENRNPVTLFSREANRTDGSIPVCSLCRRLRVESLWIDPGPAIIQNRLFSIEPVPQLEETLCAECEQTIQTELKIVDRIVGQRNE